MKKPKKRRTRTQSRFLENCIDNLRSLDFEVFNNGHFKRALENGRLPQRYIVRDWPHPCLYGTPGKKEALVVDRDLKIVIEAKYQEGSGSVDEKFPYVFEAFCRSIIPYWIVLYDGNWWQTPRGAAAIRHLKNYVVPPGKTFRVLNRTEFAEFARDMWR